MKKLVRKLFLWAFPEIKKEIEDIEEKLDYIKKDYYQNFILSDKIIKCNKEQLKICKDE